MRAAGAKESDKTPIPLGRSTMKKLLLTLALCALTLGGLPGATAGATGAATSATRAAA